jgi:hypothetical protein
MWRFILGTVTAVGRPGAQAGGPGMAALGTQCCLPVRCGLVQERPCWQARPRGGREQYERPRCKVVSDRAIVCFAAETWQHLCALQACGHSRPSWCNLDGNDLLADGSAEPPR